MRNIVDLIAYDRDGQIVLIIEAKSKTGTSSTWAATMRRNLLAHGLMPKSKFFMLALPDRLYLWKDVDNKPEIIEPTYEIDSMPFFEPYYKLSALNPERLNGESFELIVSSWMNELIRFGISSSVPVEQRKQLLESGLLDVLNGGSIAIEIAA